MNSNTFKLGVVLVAVMAITACSSKFSKLQKTGTVDQKYKAAVGYYEAKDYYRAGLLFEEISPLLRGDSTAEKAQYLNAYCNFHQGLYQMSSFQFKSFYSTYANSPLAEEAYYMYAYSMFKDSPKYNLDQTSTLTAIDALQTFINTYPQSKYAEKSAQNLIDLRAKLELKAYERAKLYYKTSGTTIANFKSAVIAIDNFKRDFPDSPYNEELSYIQLVSEQELADNSIFKVQKERYQQAMTYYEKFVDTYPESKYKKDALKAYEKAQKGLEEVAKIQAEVDEINKKNKEKATESTVKMK